MLQRKLRFLEDYLALDPASINQEIRALVRRTRWGNHFLEREVLEVLASPELHEKCRAQDMMITPMKGAQTKARVEADAQIWPLVG